MSLLKLAKLKVEHKKELSVYKRMHAAVIKFKELKKKAKKENKSFPLTAEHVTFMRTQIFHQAQKIKSIEEQMTSIETVSFFNFKVNRFETVAVLFFIMVSLTLSYLVL